MCYSMITTCIINSAVEIYIEDIFLKSYEFYIIINYFVTNLWSTDREKL